MGRARFARAVRVVAAVAAAGCVLGGAARAARAEESWATAQAAELTRQGREHAAHGDGSVGVHRFLDAIAFDPTYAPAYLALGQVEEAAGDPAEAERAYSMGIDHVARWADGYHARARLRARMRRPLEAVADLQAAVDLEPGNGTYLRELEDAYVAQRSLLAALEVARRREAIASRLGDARELADAHLRARTLGLLVAEVDPVNAGAQERGLVRSALARLARRR